MGSNDLQLEMNFSEKQQNSFRKTVESGAFSLLIESSVPGPQLPARDAVKQLRVLEEEIAGISALPCGMAIVDRPGNPEGWSGIEFASQMSEELRDRHLVYLSGFNRDPGEIDRQLAIAGNSGNFNIACVSGDLGEGAAARTDSGQIFKKVMAKKGFFGGVTVNPYQYDPWALTAQYSKLGARILSER